MTETKYPFFRTPVSDLAKSSDDVIEKGAPLQKTPSHNNGPISVTVAGDFDASSVVNNIRRMMTDPLKPEALRPVVPSFVSPLRPKLMEEKAVDTIETLQSDPEQAPSHLIPASDPSLMDQPQSESRELVPYDTTQKDALSLHLMRKPSGISWMAMGGGAALAMMALAVVWFSSGSQPTQNAEGNNGTLVASGAAGTVITASNPAQSATPSSSPFLSPSPASDGTKKGGTISESSVAQKTDDASADLVVRKVKVEPIFVNPSVPASVPRMTEPPKKTNFDEAQSLAQKVAANTDSAPKAELPKPNAKIQEKMGDRTQEKRPEAQTPQPVKNAQAANVQVAPQVAPVEAKSTAAPVKSVSAPETVKPVEAVKPIVVATTPATDVIAPPSPMDRLLRKADSLIKQGAIADARQFLVLATEGGHAMAAFRLAETYDAQMLETWGVRGGVKGETAKARAYYQQALSGGVGEARARLERLR
jgi:hypothetical protein